MITAGPTHEPIDPVRFIGNSSSGKIGRALAAEALRRGARVTVISGPVAISYPAGADVVGVTTALEMRDEAVSRFPDADIAVMCAAVADYRPASCADHKIKRSGVDEMTLTLVRNPDIAATLGAMKRSGQRLVGFALETDHAEDNGRDKLASKNLDMIVVNSLEDAGAGFGVDTNRVTMLTADGRRLQGDLKSKDGVAADIFDVIATL